MGWLGTLPFWGLHFAALGGVVAVGWSWSGFGLMLASYLARMFFVTAGYHRYFAHRSYKTSRAVQLGLAVLAMSSAQKGVLWSAAKHRRHHQCSDGPDDPHS